ncbi:MAG: hypothetical protein IKU58_00440 [Clostridia bacterium]|nr:hypothetical protein [Clostridia bacterium]
MKFKIGFVSNVYEKKNNDHIESTPAADRGTPRKSVVQVMFPGRGCSLTYYNDQFDLRVGDFVYVDGKLEGQRGRVTDVAYAFKIKVSDYKRVVALVDTAVKGQFFFAGSHLVTFDREVIPTGKVSTWFNAPAKEGDEYVCGKDDQTFRLDDPKGMKVSPEIAERGYDYYMGSNVTYIAIDGNHGYAIVEGSKPYEVEFDYCSGEIGNLTCSCYCSYHCKHEVAAMLQLKETLKIIEKHYAEQYERTGYFAAILKETLFTFAVNGQEHGSLTLN